MKNEKDLFQEELNEMLLSNQSEKVIEVFQGSWKATEEPVILATDCLSSCIGILAYDINHNFVFLSHSDEDSFYIDNSYQIARHIKELEKLLSSKKDTYNLTFIILPGEYASSKLIDAIYYSIYRIKSPNITVEQIIEQKPFIDRDRPGSSTVAYNNLNGQITPYNNKSIKNKGGR